MARVRHPVSRDARISTRVAIALVLNSLLASSTHRRPYGTVLKIQCRFHKFSKLILENYHEAGKNASFL